MQARKDGFAQLTNQQKNGPTSSHNYKLFRLVSHNDVINVATMKSWDTQFIVWEKGTWICLREGMDDQADGSAPYGSRKQ